MSKQRARIRPFSFVLTEFVAIVIASKKMKRIYYIPKYISFGALILYLGRFEFFQK